MTSQKQIVRVGRREIKLSNLEKVLFPEDQIVKAQLVEYFFKITPTILAHIKGRPLSVVRGRELQVAEWHARFQRCVRGKAASARAEETAVRFGFKIRTDRVGQFHPGPRDGAGRLKSSRKTTTSSASSGILRHLMNEWTQ